MGFGVGFLGVVLLAVVAGEEPQAVGGAETGRDEIVVVGDALLAEDSRAVRLIVTGNTEAILQWCECDSGKGFLAAKRALLLARWKAAKGTLVLDAGGAFSGDTELDVRRGEAQAAILAAVGYDAVAIGTDMLALGKEFVCARLAEADGRWICANLAIDGADVPGCVVREIDGRRVAIVGLMSRSLATPELLEKSGARVSDPLEASRKAVDGLQEKADVVIVMGNLDGADVARLAESSPAPDVVLTSASAPPRGELGMIGREYENPEKTSWVEHPSARGRMGETPVLYTQLVAFRGHVLLDVPLARVGAWGYAHVFPTKRTADLPRAKEITDRFFEEARVFGGADMAVHARGYWVDEVAAGRTYVGARRCAECHAPQSGHWAATSHAKAYTDLAAKDRWFYAPCLSCHTTGLGQATGFKPAMEPFPASWAEAGGGAMEGVQCEACHGPGSTHAADPKAKGMVVRNPGESLCVRCHDERNSPNFRALAEKYWAMVKH